MTIREKVNRRELIKKVLRTLNAFQPVIEKRLTVAELDLITEFILLPDKFDYYRFSHRVKKRVQNSLLENGWKLSIPSMNTKIYSLIEKGYLWRDEDRVIYFGKLIESITREYRGSNTEFKINFEFIIDEGESKDS